MLGPREAQASGVKAVLIGTHAERLGVPFKDAMSNLEEFAELVGFAENSGKTTGGNKDSSAKGLYQFLDNSIDEAVRRLKRTIGTQPWMEETLKHRDANKLTREQQTLLFMADLLEKTAIVDGKKIKGYGDKLMKGVMQGDKEAMKEAYRRLHHTDMEDKATEELANRVFK